MRVAIVGAGIAGLTVARLLYSAHEITVFEAAKYAGGHANTVDVQEGDRTIAVDTGFIVFNEPNYPMLCRLFAEIGVPLQASDMSFSVHCESTGREWNGSSINQVFSDRSNLFSLPHWRMLRDVRRFHSEGREALNEALADDVTVCHWLASRGYSSTFSRLYLLPLGASLWSCSQARFAQFPMRFVLEFLRNHGMLQFGGRPTWRTVKGGSRQYVSRMVAPFYQCIRFGSPVQRLCRRGRGVEVTTPGGGIENFDEVVLACHADQALRLLSDADDTERALLAAFPYQRNEAVLHTDVRMLPSRERAWASWNYRVALQPRDVPTVTYDMTRLQGLASTERWCVSLNPGQRVDPACVVRRFFYEHPIFEPGRDAIQAAHGEVTRRRGVSLCGAYWGFGFHEDGVRSAVAVCQAFDRPITFAA